LRSDFLPKQAADSLADISGIANLLFARFAYRLVFQNEVLAREI